MRGEELRLPEGAEIEIKVAVDGNVVIGVRGVKGQSCVELTRPFRDATGKVVSSRRTAEYREEVQDEDSHRVRR